MGIIEEIQEEVRAIRKEVAELRNMINNSKAAQKDRMLVSDLADKYSVSPTTIDRMLVTMREVEYNVTVAQRSTRGVRMVNEEQFDRAYMELFAKHTHQ